MPPTLLERLNKLEKSSKSRRDAAAGKGDAGDGRTPKPDEVFGGRHVRKGEDSMSSRGFEMCRAIRAMQSAAAGGSADQKAWENAKVELEVMSATRKAYGAVADQVFSDDCLQMPFCTDYMRGEADPAMVAEIKQKMYAGVNRFDPDETRWLVKRYVEKYMPPGQKADMSWLDQTAGGAMVPFPVMGEMIDLFRNQEALSQAGCTQIPMPPGGLSLPRQTSATTMVWSGENTDNSANKSVVGTGSLHLTPKKGIAFVGIPNDLIRYGGPAVEMLVRRDVTKTLALGYDYAGLQGTQSNFNPLGLINTSGISVVTPTTVATDGNTLAEQDLYAFKAALEAKNASFEAFIMHPNMYYALIGRRNDAVTASDKKGAFTFNPMRDLSDPISVKRINGDKVICSTQVSIARTKGSGTTLTYILSGMFSDVYLALFGAMEFALSVQGDGFYKDQTILRAILIGDVGVRHAASIAWADSLLVN